MISKENNLDMVSSMISPINDTHPPKYGVVIPNRIFVGGIPTQTLENELSKFFSEYGSVKDVKIIYDRAGISKGYGFVTFESEEDVKKVNSMSDSLSFKDRKLNVGPAIKKQQSNMTTATKIMQAATMGACAFGPGGSLATNGMFEATQNIHFQGGATHHYFPALGSLNGTATTILLPSFQQNQAAAAAANQLIFHPQQQTLPSNNLMMSNANANNPLFGNNVINPQYLQQQNVVHQTTPAPSGLIPLGFHAASSPLGASTTPQPQHIVIGGGAQPISNSAQSTATAFDGNPSDKMMQQSPSINNEYLNNWLAAYAATGQNQNYGLPGFGTPTPMTPTAYVLQPNPNMNINNHNNITNLNGGIYPTHHQKSNSNSNSIQYQSNGALSENGIVNNTNGANSLSSGISSPITNNSNQMNLPIIYAAQPIFMPTLPLTPNIANHTMNAYPTPLSSQQRANMIPAGAYFFATPSPLPLPHNAGPPTPPQSGNNMTTATTLVMNDNKFNGYGSFFPVYAAGSAPPTPLIMGGQMSLTNTAVASTTNTTVLLTSSSMSSQGNSNNESLGSASSEIGDKKENGPENGLLPCVANANNTVLIGSENGTTIAHNSSKAVTLSTTLNTVNGLDKAKHLSTKNAAEMSETNGFSDEMAQCNRVRCASNSNYQMIDDKNENYYGYYEVGGGKENGEEQGDNVFITSPDHNFAAQHAHKFVGENGFFYHPNGASEPLYHENNHKYLDTTKKYCYGNLSSAFNHNNDNSNFSNGHYDRNQYVAENAFENSENINNNGITNDGLIMISTPNGFVHNKNLNGLKSGAMKIPTSFTSENGLEMKNGCFPSSSIHFNGANDQNEYPPNAFDIVNNMRE